MAERTNVWVRHSLLVSALTSTLSQSGIVSSKTKTHRVHVDVRASGSASGGYRSTAPPKTATASGELKWDNDNDNDGGSACTYATGSASSEWGWVKACMLPSTVGGGSADKHQHGSSSSASEAPPLHQNKNVTDGPSPRPSGGLTVIITDPESEFDGRTVNIPAHLLTNTGNNSNCNSNNKSKQGAAGTKETGAAGFYSVSDGHVLGDDILIANSWANFHVAASHTPHQNNLQQQQKAGRTGPNALQLSGGAMELPPEDLINLTHLHEPAVVYCLRYRYSLDEIYTATGPILLALNPFKDCRKSLYSPHLMRKYWERGEGGVAISSGSSSAAAATAPQNTTSCSNTKSSPIDLDDRLPPHVFAVADNAYRAMIRTLDDQRGRSSTADLITESGNQSILVSGESGAGKTVTARFLMQYLAALSKRSAANILKAEQDNKPIFAQQQYAQPSPSLLLLSSSDDLTAMASPRSHFGTAVDASAAASFQHQDLDAHGAAFSLSPSHGTSTSRPSGIEHQVLQSNPILESFGNARTIRNDNSSRFGKFIEIKFCESGTLIGASIETYLLERVRLISRADGERNYHVFYELLAGASSSDQKKLIIDYASAEEFVATRSASGTYCRRDGIHDEVTFRELKSAMNSMGFNVEEQLDVFEIVSALLHLSNLSFVKQGYDECFLNEANYSLEAALELCGVTLDALEAALCSVVIEAGGERLVKMLGMSQCTKALEALIKATYGALFEYLVKRINGCISNNVDDAEFQHKGILEIPGSSGVAKQPDAAAAFIGVLDIFGFESFDSNSFEQLCINYCNESLQQQFNKFVFKLEQAEYEKEGISWRFIDFEDNCTILDLIDKRHTGILRILDEQCIQAFNNDKSFANSLYDKHWSNGGTSTPFIATNRQKARGMFSINHYAGPVEYNTNGFIEKNKDETPKEINELLASSENHFLQHLGEIIFSRLVVDQKNTPTRIDIHHHHKQSSLIRVSVGGQFSAQLKQLRMRIDKTAPHYIRCLKPNDELRPNHFDCALIASQLRYAGILEAIRVSRVGYPQRYLHERFLSRYSILAINELRLVRTSTNPANKCRVLVDVIAKKIWAKNHNVLLEEDKKPFSVPIACNNQTPGPRTPATRGERLPFQTPDNAGRANRLEKYRANATPPPWVSHSLRPTMATLCPKNVTANNESPLVKASIMPKAVDSESDSSASTGIPDKIDLMQIGIQLGKTKIFLRQYAFDAMESMRNRLKSIAATIINSVVRMYLSRIAYLPVRDAYRDDQNEQEAFGIVRNHNQLLDCSARPQSHTPLALVEHFENHVRIQPKKKAKKIRTFKWLVVDGHWRRNINYKEGSVLSSMQ